jgi:hypothetical protein
MGSNSQGLVAEKFPLDRADALSRRGFAVGALGVVLGGIAYSQNHEQFAFSWLFGFVVVFTLVAGAAFWNILHHATDSEWSVLIRRQVENIASIFPLLVVGFLPLLLLCAPLLWKWWNVPHGVDALLDNKEGFLNKPFFIVRAGLYFCLLGSIVWTLRRHSCAQDADGSASHSIAMRKAAIAGLPIFAVSLTFAAVDWLMGLDYHWFSTMWGVYIFAGAAGSSMSLIVLVISWLRSSGFLRAVNEEHYHTMGKFMLAFTVFWAYIGYSQYMLIWYANMPEETVYFKIRNTEGWHILSTFLVAGRFFLPFPVLLFQATKKNVKLICGVAVWIILMQILDLYVVVLPVLHQTGPSFSVFDLSGLLAVGGLAFGLYFRNLGSASLFPLRDPRLEGSVNLHN